MRSRPLSPVVALTVGLALAGCAEPYGTVLTSASGTESASDSDATSTGSTTATSETTGAPACACGPEEACVADACVDVGRSKIDAGCHPLHQGVCLYPWPSDFTTVADPSSSTGLRLAIDPALVPVNSGGLAFAAAEITDPMEGFSPNSQLRFVSPRGVMAADLAGIDDIGASLADDAAIVLLAAESGERVPYFAEVDARAKSPDRQAVFIRPMRRLAFGTRYIVAVRGLRDGEGAPLEPPPLFRALRDDLATDVPQLEAMRVSYEALFADLDAAGIAREPLQLAWEFTTTSQASLTRDAAAMMPQVKAAAAGGALGYTIQEIEAKDGKVGRVIRGTFKAPNCMTGDAGPGARLKRGAGGLPECVGTIDAPFVIAIPKSILDGAVASPVALYGHGLLGSGEEAIMVGTDWWGMSEADILNVSTVLSENFANGRSLPERLLQSVVNFTTLGYLIQSELAADEALTQGGLPLVDTSVPVSYIGGSQGGIMGGTTVALAPNLERGVLVVGGANYSLMVWRSTAFAAVNGLWEAYQADELDREFLFALYQSAFDLSDPLIYAEMIREAPLPGYGPRQLLLVEAIGDAQVPNIATELMARSYGMRMVGPAVVPVFGVPTVDEAIDDVGLLQVDTLKGPLPPKENVPADQDNGAHGASADGPGVQASIGVFLFKGEFSNKCDGPCDPD